jgi:hypothetical protein
LDLDNNGENMIIEKGKVNIKKKKKDKKPNNDNYKIFG